MHNRSGADRQSRQAENACVGTDVKYDWRVARELTPTFKGVHFIQIGPKKVELPLKEFAEITPHSESAKLESRDSDHVVWGYDAAPEAVDHPHFASTDRKVASVGV
jgi:hypothetical protein